MGGPVNAEGVDALDPATRRRCGDYHWRLAAGGWMLAAATLDHRRERMFEGGVAKEDLEWPQLGRP